MAQTQTSSRSAGVATVYAQALLELAAQTNQLETVGQEVRDLAKLLEFPEPLRLLLGGRRLTVDKRRQIVEQIFRGRVSDLLYRFLQVLAAKNRLDQLPGILRLLPQLIQQRQGVQQVDLVTATPLGDQDAAALADAIGRILGQKVLARRQVDPALVGGLKIRIGDRLLDGSVAAQLRAMRRKIIQAGQEKAKQSLGELIREPS